MSPYERYPYDQTGYGPTGIGNAPTAREMRMQQMNQFATTRGAMATQYFDPYIMGAGAAATGMISGRARSPEEARRLLYESAGGQAARDMALMARRTGFLGHGDPVNYAANISQGVSSGFMTSVGGTMGGRPVIGSSSLTSGNGSIAERVSMNFMKGMMTDLYGKGTPNPSKLHGFDIEEASQVFSTLARRGAIGNVAHIERNASIADRIGAARDAAMDPTVKAALSGIQLSGQGEEAQIASFQQLISKQDNSKVRREMEAIMKSPDAVIIKDEERKKVSRLVESVVEGMASLSDIYGELSAPELQQKLEAVSGQRITNRAQAKNATMMVEELRGAAIVSGLDPRAFMSLSGNLQAMLQGQVSRAGGFDQRTATQSKRLTAVMHQGMMRDSAIAANLGERHVMNARAKGITLADAPTLDEIYADKAQGRIGFLQDYKAVAMTMGGLEELPENMRGQAQKLLEEFEATTDPQKRQNIEMQLQNLQSNAHSRPGDRKSFRTLATGRAALNQISNAYNDPLKAERMERMAARARRGDIDIGLMVNNMASAGIGNADALGKQILMDVGAPKMERLLDISSDKAGDKRQRQKNLMIAAGMSGGAADKFLDSFFGADGAAKNPTAVKNIIRDLSNASWEGGVGTMGDANDVAAEKLAMMGSIGKRQRLRAGDKGISLGSIATALVDGTVSGLGDAESVALAIEALGEDGMSTLVGGKSVNVKDFSVTGLDFSGGLTAEGLEKLDAINGGGLGLAEKLGFKNRGALIKATQGYAGKGQLHRAIRTLQGAGYENLNLKGGPESMSAIDQAVFESVKGSGQIDELAQKLSGAKLISGALGLGEGESNGLIESAARGGKLDLGILEAAKGGEISGGKANMGDALGRIMKVSDMVHMASPAQMSSLAAVNEDGSLLEELTAQQDILAAMKKKGGGGDLQLQVAGEQDKDGKKLFRSLDETMANLAKTIDAIKKSTAIEKGAQIIEEVTVTGRFIVENKEDND